MFDSLDGWELLDSLDGRRFFGKVAESLDLPSGLQRVALEPCFEVSPTTKSLQLIPRQASPAVVRAGQQPQVDIVPQWFSTTLEFSPLLDFPFLGRYTTVACGRMDLAAYPESIRKALLRDFNACARTIERNAREASRVNGEPAPKVQ